MSGAGSTTPTKTGWSTSRVGTLIRGTWYAPLGSQAPRSLSEAAVNLVALVERRARGMAAQAQDEGWRCDACVRLIPGSAMTASLGLAWGVDCYEAMAEWPGRCASIHSA